MGRRPGGEDEAAFGWGLRGGAWSDDMAKIAQHRILVLRCGSTEWDDSGRLQGSTDLPLSKPGLVAARRTVADLGGLPLLGVLCSPDEASIATANLLAEPAGAKVTPVSGLAEIHFGLWEGMLKSELEGRFCRAGRQWDDDPACVTPPEGECFDTFAERLLPALKKAVAKAAGRRSGDMAALGVGVVLRPLADALVRCVLSGRASTEVCSVVEARPGPEWFDVAPGQPWDLKVGIGRNQTASAA